MSKNCNLVPKHTLFKSGQKKKTKGKYRSIYAFFMINTEVAVVKNKISSQLCQNPFFGANCQEAWGKELQVKAN